MRGKKNSNHVKCQIENKSESQRVRISKIQIKSNQNHMLAESYQIKSNQSDVRQKQNKRKPKNKQ